MILSVTPTPMIYSPACNIDDRSRVWIGRLADLDNELTVSRNFPPSAGSPAWFVAAQEGSRSPTPDIIGDACIVWARSFKGSDPDKF